VVPAARRDPTRTRRLTMPASPVTPIPKVCSSWQISFAPDGITDLLTMAQEIASAAAYRTQISYYGLGADGQSAPYVSVGRLGGGAPQQGYAGDYIVLSGNVVTVCSPSDFEANWEPLVMPADMSRVDTALESLQGLVE
jgi:hypothetical protein